MALFLFRSLGDQKLSWSADFPPCVLLVLSGLSLTAMWTCVAHLGYFVVCAVLLTFLRCPAFSRTVLLLSVPLNAVAEVHQQPSLDLANLSVLLLTLSLGTASRWRSGRWRRFSRFCLVLILFWSEGHWLVNLLWASFQATDRPAAPLLLAPVEIVPPHKDAGPARPSYPPSSTPQK